MRLVRLFENTLKKKYISIIMENEKSEIAETIEPSGVVYTPDDSNVHMNISNDIEQDRVFSWSSTFTESKDFKKHLNKPIKNFDEEELKFYKRLQKREQIKKKEEKEKALKEEKTKSIFDYQDEKKLEPHSSARQSQTDHLIESNLTEEDLYIQLESLKNKFPEIGEQIEVSKNMSMDTLKMKYKLFMTLIEQKHADSVAFNVFLLLNKAVERTAEGYFSTNCLNGLGDNVLQMKSEITDILKEMVSSGEIPIEMLTPQLRLLMVMSGIVVQTLEQNRAKNEQTASIVEE